MERTETVQITSHYRTGQVMPYGMTTEKVVRCLSNPVSVTDDLRELAGRYHAESKDLAAELTVPHYFRVGYEFGQRDIYLQRTGTESGHEHLMCLQDDCEDGKLTMEEYKRWLEGYLSNRKRAEDRSYPSRKSWT